MSQIRLIAIRDTPLSVDEVRNAIADPAAGGEVLFVGTVRDNDVDKGVIGLAYSAHPSAEAELRKVTEYIVAKFPDVIAACGGPPDWRPGRGGPGGRRRRVLRAPGGGLPRLPRADRRAEGHGADLEAPAVHRRHRRMGRQRVVRPTIAATAALSNAYAGRNAAEPVSVSAEELGAGS